MAFPVNVDSTWVNPGSVALDAGELRRADSAIFGGDGSALGVRGGIVRHGDTSLAVTVDGSDVVTVQPGAVVIPGNAVSGSGCYRSALASSATGNLAARNATNPRIDLVVFRQMDTDVVGTHGAYTGRIEVIAGTPSATPGVPTLPSMAVELARISVPASGGGAASVDSSFRIYASAIGGRLPVPTAARLPATAPAWQEAVALDTGVHYRRDGGGWKAAGVVAMSLTNPGSTNASGFIDVPVTLPFTPTAVHANVRNSQYHISVDDANTSATNIRVYFRRLTDGSVVPSTAVGAIQLTAVA